MLEGESMLTIKSVTKGKEYLIVITNKEGETILSIEVNGIVYAPSIEAASEAGKVFIESIRATLAKGTVSTNV